MHEFFDHAEVKRFFTFATFAITLLGIFLLFESLNALKAWRTSTPAYNTIAVSGQGEAFATPDIATFSFTVSADAAAVSDAQDAVTKKTDTITAALKDLGIDSTDIQTTDYSLYPKYVYQQGICQASGICPPSRQVPDGYTVSNTLSVKVRETANAGKALSAAGQNGATNISSLDFTVDDPSMVEADARTKAIDDAKTKANALAKSLGVSLSRVVSFSDNSSGGGPVPIYAADTGLLSAAKAAPTPTLQPGQNKVTDNVTVTYEIR